MEDTKLIVKKRDLEGSSNARRLRKSGSIPAIIYGAAKEPVSVEINTHDFGQILHHNASESFIIHLDLEGEGDVSVLVKDVQRHPVSSDLIHVDMLRIVAGQAIQVEILLELVGEAAGVKEGGVLDHVMHSVMVECLPRDLVESIDVDISEMNIGDALHAADIDFGDKFKALVADDVIVATISGPTAEEEEPEEGAVASAEPEVITEKKEEE